MLDYCAVEKQLYQSCHLSLLCTYRCGVCKAVSVYKPTIKKRVEN